GAPSMEADVECDATQSLCNGRCLMPGESEGRCTVLARNPTTGGTGVAVVDGTPYMVGNFGLYALSDDRTDVQELVDFDRGSEFQGEFYGFRIPYLSRYATDGTQLAYLADRIEPQTNVVRVGDWVIFVAGFVDSVLVRVPHAGLAELPEEGFEQGMNPLVPVSLHASGSVRPNSELFADDQYVYWQTNSGLYRQAPEETEPTQISDWFVDTASFQDGHFYFFALDGITLMDEGLSLFKLPAAGGEPVELAPGEGNNYPHVVGDHVYFLDHNEATVFRVPTGGGEREPMATLAERYHQSCDARFADDGSTLYLACQHLIAIALD
ncbi:MAG: hypothetical protein OXT09_35445, partial [Myxococcales bacterium]|nr:hypothetical protein [Myxococcales bacterium]